MTKTKPWYQTVQQVKGPLIFLNGLENPKYGEICNISIHGKTVQGQVLETTKDTAVVQVFGSTLGVDKNIEVQFTGKPAQVDVSETMLGKTFNGLGKSLSKTNIVPEKTLDINGAAINPTARTEPNKFIETGVSTIDSMITLVRGQKLPIFSSAGLPHNNLAAQLVKNSNVQEDKFAIVFGAMGITKEESLYFKEQFKLSGSAQHTVSFINLADDPSVERIMTPRVALTTAEYLAFEKDYHVLTILTDFTNYCESLREISGARNEIPGRRGYPGYMYTDLASIYERAGKIKGKPGSLTQIPILTMPSGDKTHPVPDLTGYITEGQIALDKDLDKKGIQPPINPLESLSRLDADEEDTREDHGDVSDQLYTCYAKAIELQQLVAVIGEGSLSNTEKKYLSFAEAFEETFINQGFDESYSIEETLEKAWEILRIIPREELKKVGSDIKDTYY